MGAGGVAQVVEHLLCKLKALSSNPNSIEKIKKQKKNSLGNIFQKILVCKPPIF
jgi:hypothetical protein